jgi:hypothetical protein
MAFMVMYDTLDSNNNLEDYKKLTTAKKTSLASTNTQPQIRNYEVRSSLKAVDFNVAANSLEEAKQLEQTLLNGRNSTFIEVYTFEAKDHANKNRCKDEISSDTVCEAVCKQTECTNFNKTCTPLTENGCRYTVRAYYDELYKTASLKKLTSEEAKQCDTSTTGLTCTHQVTATYSQLFSKVDLNRVSACSADIATGISNCPVEMRAEFSDDAKFYLISPGAKL